MRRSVWKYAIPVEDRFKLSMPAGAKPLSVQVQNGAPMLWALVEPDNKPHEAEFLLAGTGHEIELPTNAVFIGTFQMHGGALVFHLFLLAGS